MTETCDLCNIKINKEMIKKTDDLTQCYDCIFSMNFNDKNILNGSEGYDLKKYIEISLKYHLELYDLPCHRFQDNKGCYVCMKLFDIPFELPIDVNNNDNDNDKNIKSTKSKSTKSTKSIDSIKSSNLFEIKDNNYCLSENITLNI
jgi:hypothetical protein